jgi:hypothetical protein
MELMTALAMVLPAAGLVAVVFFAGYRAVLWAKRQAKGAYVLGAVLIPLGSFGKVTDPDGRIVLEAQQSKRKEEDDNGDPPER